MGPELDAHLIEKQTLHALIEMRASVYNTVIYSPTSEDLCSLLVFNTHNMNRIIGSSRTAFFGMEENSLLEKNMVLKLNLALCVSPKNR